VAITDAHERHRPGSLPMTALTLALLLGALPARALEAAAPNVDDEAEATFRRAQSAYQSGDYAASARTLAGLIAGMEADGATPAPRDRWTRALLRLAQVEATLGHGAPARSAIERALAVEPGLAPDPEQYSPRFRREVEQARARLELAPRFRLEITSVAAGADVQIDGQPVGAAPVEVRLPSGRYHVGVRSGAGGGGARIDLARDERVAVDAGGPARPGAGDRPADLRLAAAPPPTGGGLSLHAEAPGGWMRPTAVATGGLALVAAGLSVWQGVVAASARDEASAMLLPDGMLRPGARPADYAAATASFETARTNAWIAGGSAAALACGAVLLWVLAPGAPVAPAPSGVALAF
jgi:hypothetical protein